jgi:O-antigen/teichoic acid export membrane protein
MLSRTFSQATAVVLGVILVRLISEEVLGTYRQAFLVYYFVAALIAFHLESSLYYFVPNLEEARRRLLVLQTILMAGVASLAMGAVLFFGSGVAARLLNNPELASLVRVLWLYPLVDALALLVPAYMVSVDRAPRAGVYSAAASVARVSVVVAGFAAGLSLATVLWLAVLAVGVVAAVGCFEMVRFTPPGALRLDRALALRQIQYTWPIWTTTAVGVLNVRFDKLLISNVFDPATYAVYSCGAFEVPVAFLVTGSIGVAMMPTLAKLVRDGRTEEALSIWREAARKGGLIVFPCFALLLPLSRDLIVLLYRENYAMAAWPFAIYLLVLPLRVVLYSSFLRAVGRTRPIAVSAAMGLVVNVVVSVALVRIGEGGLLSFIGPSIGTVFSAFVTVAYLIRSVGASAGVPASRVMPWSDLWPALAVSAAAGAVVYLLPVPDVALPARVLIRAGVFIGVFGPAVLLTGILRDDERRLLLSPARAIGRLVGRLGRGDA